MSDRRDGGRSGVPTVAWFGGFFVVVAGIIATLAAVQGGVSLPGLFVALSASMLLFGLAALWQSLRTAFGGGPETLDALDAELPERLALMEEKQTLLRAIKDIAFEREVGKISDEDFARLDRAYRRRAREVLQLLDEDIEPFVRRAKQMVAEASGDDEPVRGSTRGAKKGAKGRSGKSQGKAARAKSKGKHKHASPVLACPHCGEANDLDAIFCKSCAGRIAPVVCAKCDTENDADAKFCKSCATPLAAAAEAAEASVSADGASSDGASKGAAKSASGRAEADEPASSSASDDEDEDASRDESDDEGSDEESDDEESDDEGSDEDESDGEESDDEEEDR